MTIEVFGSRARRRQVLPEAGMAIVGHKHNFDHESEVEQGAAQFQLLEPTEWDNDGDPIDFEVIEESPVLRPGDAPYTVVAGRYHRYIAKEDNTIVNCWYWHREPINAAIVPAYDGWQAAYE